MVRSHSMLGSKGQCAADVTQQVHVLLYWESMQMQAVWLYNENKK